MKCRALTAIAVVVCSVVGTSRADDPDPKLLSMVVRTDGAEGAVLTLETGRRLLRLKLGEKPDAAATAVVVETLAAFQGNEPRTPSVEVRADEIVIDLSNPKWKPPFRITFRHPGVKVAHVHDFHHDAASSTSTIRQRTTLTNPFGFPLDGGRKGFVVHERASFDAFADARRFRFPEPATAGGETTSTLTERVGSVSWRLQGAEVDIAGAKDAAVVARFDWPKDDGLVVPSTIRTALVAKSGPLLGSASVESKVEEVAGAKQTVVRFPVFRQKFCARTASCRWKLRDGALTAYEWRAVEVEECPVPNLEYEPSEAWGLVACRTTKPVHLAYRFREEKKTPLVDANVVTLLPEASRVRVANVRKLLDDHGVLSAIDEIKDALDGVKAVEDRIEDAFRKRTDLTRALAEAKTEKEREAISEKLDDNAALLERLRERRRNRLNAYSKEVAKPRMGGCSQIDPCTSP